MNDVFSFLGFRVETPLPPDENSHCASSVSFAQTSAIDTPHRPLLVSRFDDDVRKNAKNAFCDFLDWIHVVLDSRFAVSV